jgi:hypothetical protein
MKVTYSFALIALLALAACGPSRKEKAKQRLLNKCVTEAGRQAGDPKMQVFIKDYCSCVVEKFEQNLTVDELDALDTMNEQSGAAIYARLAPLVQPCIHEQQEKIKNSRNTK